MRFPTLYFDWLQKDNPTGAVDQLPELRNTFDTSVPGIYCIGDLTGIPLIKLAAESGHDLIERLAQNERFTNERHRNSDPDTYDLVIVGAGPSGISASLHAQELGMRHVVLESTRMFSTIVNFPAGKPIYVTPEEPPMRSALQFSDGTKETLLEQLDGDVQDKPLPVRENETAKRIVEQNGRFVVESDKGRYAALRVVVAIGKNGNPRRLGVPGERLPKVFTRLIDPGEHSGQRVLVVGGGDSAVEAAVALARSGAKVTLSYRRAELSRPKEHNIAAFEKAVASGSIEPVFESTVREITDDAVVLNTRSGERTVENDAVFGLIGTEIPIAFFKRSGIRMAREKRPVDWIMLATLLLFSCVLYFGKKAPVTGVHSLGDFLRVPSRMSGMSWPNATNAVLAWLSYLGMLAGGLFLTGYVAAHPHRFFDTAWNTTKHLFYAAMFLLFGYVYFSHNLNGTPVLGYDPGFWYTTMYSLTIVIFGFRRIHVNPTGYIRRQTYALMAIQVVPLFILPVFVFPALGAHGLLGGWVMTNVFPGESYWRAYGFVLAWPLFIYNLATGQPTVFWLVVGLIQTFAIIPWLNYRWGKGAYCGWICSCGALAETLGDEYRTKAPHGFAAKKGDNAGQVVLWFAAALTLAVAPQAWTGWHIPGADTLKSTYEILVDIVFAGVLGLGVYFFLSGRFWCRFLCPLAALMHIYTRFSLYRIRADKKRCISCNVCTKVCHMGIDVMGYANRGVPMNDVECVRCSACVVNCPMQVLTFGSVDRIDLDNTRYRQKPVPLQTDWSSGLSESGLRTLLEQRPEKHERKQPAAVDD